MTRRATEGADDDLAQPQPQPQPRPLARGALALRVGHAAIAVAELGCLGYVWTCALTGRRDPLLRAAIGVLATEGVALVIGRGDCPLGPLQQRMGDPVPLFELVLPPVWARRAVPILAGISGLGIALALRPVGRRPRVPRLAA